MEGWNLNTPASIWTIFSFLSTTLAERIRVVLLWLLDLIDTETCDSIETKKNTRFRSRERFCVISVKLFPYGISNFATFAEPSHLFYLIVHFSSQNNPELGSNPLLLSCYVAVSAIYSVWGRNYGAFKGE